MRIQILGTAAAEAWPALFCRCDACQYARAAGGHDIRTRAGTLIDQDVLIDFSPDALLHAHRHGLSYSDLSAILISHDHEDHFYIDDLAMAGPVFSNTHTRIALYGNEGAVSAVDKLNLAQFRTGRLMPFQKIDLGKGRFATALPALHAKDRECFIFAIEGPKGAMLYGHDTGIFPEETFAYLKNIKLRFAMLDCTTGPRKEGTNHMGVPDCVQVRERLLSQGTADKGTRFVLTHFSHNGGLHHRGLIDMATPLGFEVAYDGIVFELE